MSLLNDDNISEFLVGFIFVQDMKIYCHNKSKEIKNYYIKNII